MKNKPNRLYIGIGGMLGFCEIRFLKGELQYRCGMRDEGDITEEIIPVNEKMWEQFRSELDSIGIWKWNKHYPNPRVCDGTMWNLLIGYPDKKITSSGDNNYPLANGSASEEPNSTKTFDRFLKAVEKLIGGREFY